MTTTHRAPFADWVILELRGRRRLAGYLTEQHIAGASFLRLDIPGADDDPTPLATQYYSPSSVSVITPTSEETARTVADVIRHVPVRELDPADDHARER